MNVPMLWLKEYVDIDCDVQQFEDEMTMSGSKVETVERLGHLIKDVVVGRVESIVQHPNADKLVITQINIGREENIQIVTGAKNLFVGAYVPVVLDGGVIADGTKIKKGKLRGEVSDGMLCSISELGYDILDYPEASEEGIYIFKEEQKLGDDVTKVLELCDDVVEFEITSNRPDCFSIIGIAREASATFRKSLKIPEIIFSEGIDGDITKLIDVSIENEKLCKRYIARVVKNVKIGTSPQWLRHRLTASGIKPINNIVDITNYVMLEYGQPMHAFDINCIEGKKVIVRNAKASEKVTTLDGVERILDESMLVIANENKAMAVAGVMGGENSKITENVSTVLFESASFDGTNVRLTSKKLGLRTDSSSKYEKGLDPNLSEICINRAMQLVEELGCGEVVKGMIDVYPNKQLQWEVNYDTDRVNALLGTEISKDEMIELLDLVAIKGDGKKAIIPTFRPDVQLEADIAEEVARLYGYNKIQETPLSGVQTLGKKTFEQNIKDIIRSKMVSYGFYEILTYSFESPKVFDKLNICNDSSMRETVKIINPLGEDFSIMKTSSLNGMLTSLSTNYNRRNENVSLFELSKNYIPKKLPLDELPKEYENLMFGAYGNIDFFHMKGVLEQLFSVFRLENIRFINNRNIEFLHIGRQAEIMLGDNIIGYIGEVHPIVCDNYEIGTRTYIANICIDKIIDNINLNYKFKEIPKFPSMTRDIALIVEDKIEHYEIENIIIQKSGKAFESTQLFDVYKGSQIKEGYKSLAYKITFRANDRTLTEQEVSKSMDKIIECLSQSLGAELRDK